MRGKVDTPSQCCRGDEDLDVLVPKQFFDQGSLDTVHAGVVDGKAVRKQVLKNSILPHTSKQEELEVLETPKYCCNEQLKKG